MAEKVSCTCLTCEKVFQVTQYEFGVGRGKYCSRECFCNKKSTKVARTCLCCGKEFFVVQSRVAMGYALYCSHPCKVKMQDHPKSRIPTNCQHCGKEFETLPCHVKNGAGKYCSKQCKWDAQKGVGKSHGHTWEGGRSSTYTAWSNMKGRCTNPSFKSFHRYGGRGISVHERWLKFENFLEDMGEVPEGMTLERVDNDGNYEPGNVIWASRRDQYRNRSSNVWVTHNGVRMIARDAADMIGIDFKGFRRRMENWPEKDWFLPKEPGRHLANRKSD